MFMIDPAENPRDVACTVNDLADFVQQFFENSGDRELRINDGASSGMIAILEMIKTGVSHMDAALKNENMIVDEVNPRLRVSSRLL